MVDVNTSIGKPVVIDEGITVIPISKLTYGFASGGSEFSDKNDNKDNLFGGGTGAGVTVSPIAFIVINDGNVSMLRIESSSSTVDKALDVLPEVLEKIKSFFNKKGKSKGDVDKESNQKSNA